MWYGRLFGFSSISSRASFIALRQFSTRNAYNHIADMLCTILEKKHKEYRQRGIFRQNHESTSDLSLVFDLIDSMWFSDLLELNEQRIYHCQETFHYTNKMRIKLLIKRFLFSYFEFFRMNLRRKKQYITPCMCSPYYKFDSVVQSESTGDTHTSIVRCKLKKPFGY